MFLSRIAINRCVFSVQSAYTNVSLLEQIIGANNRQSAARNLQPALYSLSAFITNKKYLKLMWVKNYTCVLIFN